ncbi:diguanylate cyclase [Marinactinospora thermotolerans]|nr:GGDEF domain-containing protein [Marinactinospora thermotolerans]
MREWPLFSQPRALVWFIGLVITVDLLCGAGAVVSSDLVTAEVVAFVALVLCAAVCVEAMRRLGIPAGITRDLLGAWWIPVFLLLPPVYSLLAPVPIYLMLQYRIRRAIVFRRVFSAASVALAGFTASAVFDFVAPQDVLFSTVLGGAAVGDTLISARGFVAAAACCVLFTVLNTIVVAIAVHLSTSEGTRRRRMWDRETVLLDGAELCVGLIVAILCGLSPLLLLVALPPVLLLQRSLMFQQLQTAARTDPKTGLLNATTWEHEAEAELARALETGRPVAVLIVDIDHFKRVNDTYGHLFGDQVLLGVANTITHQLRQYDIVGRFGGEEFVALLPGADMAEACRVAERLRSRVGRMALPVDETTVSVTISVGVALLRVHGRDLIELMAAADLALYRAKDSGRNRVRLPATPASALRDSEPPAATAD